MAVVKRFLSILFLIWSLLIFIELMIIVLPFILICSAIFKEKSAQDSIFLFLKFWAQAFSVLCFLSVRVINSPNPKQSYIYVSNHNSYLDAVAAVLAVPGSFKPLGKIEMLKMPIFGLIYRRVVVLIDRKDKLSRAKSMEELKKDLAGGQSIFIFPEGTMNKTEAALSEFYDGAFRLSLETNTPIMPMVILNARKLFPRDKPFEARPGVITCIFDKAVAPDTEAGIEGLKSRVFTVMEAMIRSKSNT